MRSLIESLQLDATKDYSIKCLKNNFVLKDKNLVLPSGSYELFESNIDSSMKLDLVFPKEITNFESNTQLLVAIRFGLSLLDKLSLQLSAANTKFAKKVLHGNFEPNLREIRVRKTLITLLEEIVILISNSINTEDPEYCKIIHVLLCYQSYLEGTITIKNAFYHVTRGNMVIPQKTFNDHQNTINKLSQKIESMNLTHALQKNPKTYMKSRVVKFDYEYVACSPYRPVDPRVAVGSMKNRLLDAMIDSKLTTDSDILILIESCIKMEEAMYSPYGIYPTTFVRESMIKDFAIRTY